MTLEKLAAFPAGFVFADHTPQIKINTQET